MNPTFKRQKNTQKTLLLMMEYLMEYMKTNEDYTTFCN